MTKHTNITIRALLEGRSEVRLRSLERSLKAGFDDSKLYALVIAANRIDKRITLHFPRNSMSRQWLSTFTAAILQASTTQPSIWHPMQDGPTEFHPATSIAKPPTGTFFFELAFYDHIAELQRPYWWIGSELDALNARVEIGDWSG